MRNSLFLIVFLLPAISLAQVKVVDFDDLKAFDKSNALPSPNGKVLVTEDYGQVVPGTNQAKYNPPEIEGWPILGISNTTARGSRFIDIDLDGENEVIFATGNIVRAYTPAGEVKPGWPVTLGSYGVEGAPSVGNVDEDPELEIMVHTTLSGVKGELYVINYDGTIQPNFPIYWPNGGPQKEPLLENIDEDPEFEIFSHVYNWPTSFVYAHNGDGTIDNYWQEKELDYIPGSGCSSGDITGDGIPEIIACSFWKLYAFTIKGQPIEGFPFTFEQDVRSVSYSNPVIADIDEDGMNEIIVGTCNMDPVTDAGAVYVINHDGTVADGWPQYTLRWIYAPVSIVDFDQDGHLDVLVGDQVLSPSPDDYLHAWDKDGNTLPGFPVGSLDAINIQGMVSDFDDNGDLEIVVDNNTTGQPYQIFNHDGTEFTGFTLNPVGATFFNTTLLADINSDGILNIIAPTCNFQSLTTDMHIYDLEVSYQPDLVPLGVPQYNSRNTGEITISDPITSLPEKDLGDALQVNVGPNPFKNHIYVKVPAEGLVEIQLFDPNGRVIFIYKYHSTGYQTETVQVNEMPSGVYFIRVIQGNSVFNGKMIRD